MGSRCSCNRGVECRDCRSARAVAASRLERNCDGSFVIALNEEARVGQTNVKISLGYGERADACYARRKSIGNKAARGPQQFERWKA